MTKVFGNLLSFLQDNKKYWLTPVFITIALLAIAIILSRYGEVAAFIYSF